MTRATRAGTAGRQGPSVQLREAIERSGLTAYAVGRRAGVDPGVVQRFVTGERDIRMGTADKLCEVLGLRLVEDGRRKKGRPARPSVAMAELPWGEEEGADTAAGAD